MDQVGLTAQNQARDLAYRQPSYLGQQYHCPHCGSEYLPRIERRISNAGWITFAVLMVAFFPLFWIGLLIKEDVRICPSCLYRVA
jgi:RNA polymerase subunit RPABC4/transcription elongation factor Spt4